MGPVGLGGQQNPLSIVQRRIWSQDPTWGQGEGGADPRGLKGVTIVQNVPCANCDLLNVLLNWRGKQDKETYQYQREGCLALLNLHVSVG